jgi:hypothetical protein
MSDQPASDIVEVALSPEDTLKVGPLVRSLATQGKHALLIATAAPVTTATGTTWRLKAKVIDGKIAGKLLKLIGES